MALASWFVCGLTFVYPLLVLFSIARGTSVRTPLLRWWGIGWVSIVLAAMAISRMQARYDPLLIVASAFELIALYFCWRIPRDFRAADQSWNPRAELVQRS